jgi:hypothetical protein
MEVSGQLRAPAVSPPAKVSPVPFGQDAESAQSRFSSCGKVTVKLCLCLIN